MAFSCGFDYVADDGLVSGAWGGRGGGWKVGL
jgi:hypothetical protein